MRYVIVSILVCLPLLSVAQQMELGLNLGHSGAITGLRFSADGRYLLSSSEDQTMKLWDVQSGKLLQTSPEIYNGPFLRHLFLFPEQELAVYFTRSAIRNWYNWIWNLRENSFWDARELYQKPIDLSLDLFPDTSDDPAPDYESELNTVKGTRFSNNGKPVYFTNGVGPEHAGFYPGGQLYYQRAGDQLSFHRIWEEKAGQTVTYQGLSPIFAFNTDGQYLFGSPEGPAGREFTIWKTKEGTVHAKVSLPDNTYLNDISPDGKHLLISNAGGQSSLYDLARQQLLPVFHRYPPTQLIPPGDQPETLVFNQAAFSPDGRLVARGGTDGTIYLHHASGGKLKNELKGYTEAISAIRFSTDGHRLHFRLSDGSRRSWDLNTGIVKTEPEAEPPAAAEIPEGAIGISDDEQLAVLRDADNQLSLWDLPAKRKIRDLSQVDEILGLEYILTRAVFSPDKRRILFLTRPGARLATSIHLLWDIENNQRVGGIPVSINQGISSTAFSPDGNFLLLGHSTGRISVYDQKSSKKITEFDGHPNPVTQFAFSGLHDQLVVSATSARDGTVKLWDLKEKKAVASLINLAGQQWVVITPKGLFDASSQAMELLFYKVRQDNKTEIIELEQLKSRYYEPGILQKLLANEYIRPVDGLEQPPLYPELSARIENDQLRVQLKERSGGIGPLSIFVNGKEVAADANPGRQTSVSYDLRPVQNYLFRHPDSTNTLSLRVHNRDGWLKSGPLELSYRPTAWARGSGNEDTSWQGKLDPKMYVLTIGTSDYGGTGLDLQYAAKDATAMAKALLSVGAKLFADGDSIEVYALTSAAAGSSGLEGTPIHWKFASKENIKATLNIIKNKAKAEDVLLVYLAGHGLTHGSAEQSQFYYLTGSVTSEDMISDKDVREKYTISSSELTDWINEIAALKQVLVVDACNSGKVVENLTASTRALNSSQIRALDRMKDRTGMFILSGSAADKVSYETSVYGQGLLTYSLLQGMLGVATRKTADGDYVDVMKLFQYARDEVPRLAAAIDGIQTPMLGFPASGASFDIGIVTDQSSIPIGRKKPVITRPVFLNQNTLDDDLGLIGLLEKEFRKETEEGSDADLIYIDDNEKPGTYSVKGMYKQEGGRITLQLKLHGGPEPVSLNIAPTDNLKRLVREIVKSVKRHLSNTQ